MKPSRLLLSSILALGWAGAVRADLGSYAYLTPAYPATLTEGQTLAFPFENLPFYGNTTNAFGNYAKGSLEYTMGDRARMDVKFYDSALAAMTGTVARTVTLDSTGSGVKEIAFLPFAPEFSPQGWMDREGVLTVTVTRGSVTMHKLGAVVVKDAVKYTGDSAQTQYLDTDGDGLTDADEATRGTNPNLKDTDSDGVTDGREVADGTNPTNANSYNNLSKNLVAYYPFNGNANDESGNGNHGTITAATLTNSQAGRAASAYRFDGTNARIVTKNIPVFSNSFTASAWVRPESVAAWGTILDSRTGVNAGLGLEISNAVSFTTSGGSSYSLLYSTSNLTVGSWVHVTAVYNGTQKQVFLNGTLNSSVAYSTALLPTTEPFVLGDRGATNAVANSKFRGTMDEVRIYDRALSAAEVAQMYAQESDPAGSVSEVLARWDFSGGLGPTSTASGIGGSPLECIGANFITDWAWGNPDPGVKARAWLGGRNNGRYFSVRITNNLTCAVPITGVRLDLRNEGPGTGPTGFAVMSSADNYASDVATGSLDWSSRAWVNVNAKMNTVLQPGQALEVRVTGWGANSIPPQGGHLIMDNVVVLGGTLDSDGDGVTDAWERGYGRYQIISGNFTWEQAKSDAEVRGGHLATITSSTESDFIFQLFGATLGDSSARAGGLANHTWLGASDAATEGTWRWVNGEAWSYTRWGPGEPGNGSVANYLTLFNASNNGHIPGKTWNDDQNTATEQYRYLLEFGYPTDPTKADTDGDGFDDKAETIAGTDPNSATAFPDTQAPVITLIGANPLEIYKGSTFSDPGATVTDNKDATRTITGSGTVNTSTVGIYTLTYTAQDAAGNLALPVTRTVNVVLDPSADEDGDGLTNGTEISGGTNPYQKDSDNDGVNDPVEIADGTNPNDASSYNNLNKGLVAYYPFNGNANDESGNGRNGVVVGATLANDRFGVADRNYHFSGANQWIYANEIPEPTNNSFTWSCWVRAETLPSGPEPFQWILNRNNNNQDNLVSPHLTLRPDGKFFFTSYSMPLGHEGNLRNILTTPPLQWSTNRWVHVVATSDTNHVRRIYINGSLVGQITSSDYGQTGLGTLNIGADRMPSADNPYFMRGNIDDVRVYNRTLSGGEAIQLYQSEVGSLDSDGDGLTDAWERGFGRYQIISGNFTWEQAKVDAVARGGHLATITSSQEQAFVEQNLNLPAALAGSTWIWIGGADRLQEGDWRWVTGEAWNYANWAPNEPSNGWGGIEHYLVMNDHWNDVSDTIPGYQYGYILEFGYPSDPTKADTDEDGVNDRMESVAGTDPNDPAVWPDYTPISLSAIGNNRLDNLLVPYHGFNYGTNLILGDIPFAIPGAGNNVWHAANVATDGQVAVTLAVNVPRVVGFASLINTYWGRANGAHASLTFHFSDGSSYTKPLVSNVDIRDYHRDSLWADQINGTSTVEAWSLSPNANPRLDRQYVNLVQAGHSGKTLTSVVLTDNASSVGTAPQRVFLAGATAVSLPSLDNQPPVITLVGANPLEIYKGASFTDPGATVTDNVDATRTITGSGTVNTSTVGIYTLTYTATDAAGNLAVPMTRTVNVVLDPAADEDGDGLANGTEISGGTNPYQKDSDNDGVNDPLEIADGTSPTDANSYNGLNRGLVAYYPLDGSGTNRVSASYVLQSYGVTYETGLKNQAATFNGLDRYLKTDDLFPITGQEARSISVWLKPRSLWGASAILRWGSPDNPGTTDDLGFGRIWAFHLGEPESGSAFVNAHYRIYGPPANSMHYSTNVWMHLVCTYSPDSDQLMLYLNGTPVEASVAPGAWVGAINTSATPLHVGILKPGSGRSADGWHSPWDGWMDELKIYNRALTAAEASQLFEADTPNHAPVASGSASLTAVPQGVQSYVLQGEQVGNLFWDNFSDTADHGRTNSLFVTKLKRSYSYNVSVAEHGNPSAFAALKNDGSVVTWGDPALGGDCAAVESQLSSGVVEIYSSRGAFAALKTNGAVITWGAATYGGDSSAVAGFLAGGVREIYSTARAFAALKEDGSVVSWGDRAYGGDSSPASSFLSSGIKSISASEEMFGAMRSDGQALVWYGWPSYSVQFSGPVAGVFPNRSGFAILKNDGSLESFGGATVPSDRVSLLACGVLDVYGSDDSFAAQKTDGSLVTWGGGACGKGDIQLGMSHPS